MPKILLHIFLPLSLLCFTTEQSKYDKVFAEDYTKALRFLRTNFPAIQKITLAKNNDVALLSSTVFPELVRYSVLKDLLETGALELMYVEHGASVADFSIGAFQMKPSFVEDLENTVLKNDSLSKIYPTVISFIGKKEKEKRNERLKRLRSISWQVMYANCFLSVMELKYKEKKFASANEKIKFYACAYNGGFHRKEKDIESAIALKQFPYGKKYTGEQYAYSDVADDFYQQQFTKLFTPSCKKLQDTKN